MHFSVRSALRRINITKSLPQKTSQCIAFIVVGIFILVVLHCNLHGPHLSQMKRLEYNFPLCPVFVILFGDESNENDG